jgi:hypothetical protein
MGYETAHWPSPRLDPTIRPNADVSPNVAVVPSLAAYQFSVNSLSPAIHGGRDNRVTPPVNESNQAAKNKVSYSTLPNVITLRHVNDYSPRLRLNRRCTPHNTPRTRKQPIRTTLGLSHQTIRSVNIICNHRLDGLPRRNVNRTQWQTKLLADQTANRHRRFDRNRVRAKPRQPLRQPEHPSMQRSRRHTVSLQRRLYQRL